MVDPDMQGLVIDFGSGMIKAGFSGDDAPRTVFPTFIGRPKYPGWMVGMDAKDCFVGDEAQAKRGVLNLKCPIPSDGETSINCYDVERIFHQSFYNELSVTPEEHPLMTTSLPSMNEKKYKFFTESLFETFNVPAFSMCDSSVLALYSYGKTSGCVVESGSAVTKVTTIFEESPIQYSRVVLEDQKDLKKKRIAGSLITDIFAKMMKLNGKYVSKTNSEREIIRDMKEKYSELSLDYKFINSTIKKGTEKKLPVEYELPDGEVVDLDVVRYLPSEILFRPLLIGYEIPGIHELTKIAIDKCNPELHELMYNNIVLCGGSTLIGNFPERYKIEIEHILPKKTKIESSDERSFSPWIGGSILSSLSTFQQCWVLKSDYDEYGYSILERKSPKSIRENNQIGMFENHIISFENQRKDIIDNEEKYLIFKELRERKDLDLTELKEEPIKKIDTIYPPYNNNNISSGNNYSFRWAARNGHLEILKLLLSNDEIPNYKRSEDDVIDPCGNNNEALFYSIRNNHLKVVEYLLTITKMNQNIIHDIIYESCKYERIEISKFLILKFGEDSILWNKLSYYNALKVACVLSKIEIVKQLTNENKDLYNELTPHEISILLDLSSNHLYEEEKISEILINSYDGVCRNDNFLIIWATTCCHLSFTKLLLKKENVYPSARNNQSLIYSSRWGNYEIVKLLINHPLVNPSARNNLAIHEAVNRKQWNIVKLLLKNSKVLETKVVSNIFNFKKIIKNVTKQLDKVIDKGIYGPLFDRYKPLFHIFPVEIINLIDSFLKLIMNKVCRNSNCIEELENKGIIFFSGSYGCWWKRSFSLKCKELGIRYFSEKIKKPNRWSYYSGGNDEKTYNERLLNYRKKCTGWTWRQPRYSYFHQYFECNECLDDYLKGHFVIHNQIKNFLIRMVSQKLKELEGDCERLYGPKRQVFLVEKKDRNRESIFSYSEEKDVVEEEDDEVCFEVKMFCKKMISECYESEKAKNVISLIDL